MTPKTPVPDSSTTSDTVASGGVTLADLVLMISAGWAVPSAVEATLGKGWLLNLAWALSAVGAILWTWQCKKIEWYLCTRLWRPDDAAAKGTIAPRAGFLVYMVVLAGTLGLQYGLYRGLSEVLRRW